VTYTLVWTSAFTRAARKFLRRHPELTRRFDDTLLALERDPQQPHLRLHALSGELEGLYAVRLTYAYRIVLILRVTEHEVVLYDIGGHDEAYR